MLTAQTQYSLRNARSYFREHLRVGDYYDESQSVAGIWFGEGALRLGLTGVVRSEAFLAACENRHPENGELLTQRLNTVRETDGCTVANRRVFYDFTFSPPKSVSIAAMVGQDERIPEAHARAVCSALAEFEAFAATRVRKGGVYATRLTRNLVSALFTHDTSRALDPHLHTHVIVFNATWDPKEVRWKALENQELLKARKFAENAYYHELAKQLRSFGYGLRDRVQGDFEIEGISAELCARFSKRHSQINDSLARLLKEKPELARGDLMGIRRRIASTERARKQRDLTSGALRQLWHAQVTPDEQASLGRLCSGGSLAGRSTSLAEAIMWAEEHLFDRHSVVPEHRIWQEALGRARGGGFSISELKAYTASRGYLRTPERALDVTRRDVWERELAIIRLAKEGAAAWHPLVWEPKPLDPRLDDDQRTALASLLGSTHGVTVFRGGAGTGKSFVLRQLVDQVRENGRPIVVLAPQRQQVVEMEKSGFPTPTTVSQVLVQKELPEGALVVVDEAGQIGGRQMLELLELAANRKARVILSGDTRQHGPVEASDALLAIERHAGMTPITLHRIRRQDPALARTREEEARIRAYRTAVEVAAKGDLAGSFEQLERMGAIVPCSPMEQAERLASEYARLTSDGASTVVISQTWSEVHRLNERIRDALKGRGLLGPEERTVTAWDRLDLTSAQKRDERFYPADAVVVFNQKVRSADPGASGKFAGILKGGILVEVDGRFVNVSDRFLDRFSVCLPRELPVAPGDRLHLKANRRLGSGGRATNGELVTVKGVTDTGVVELTDGRVLDRNYREFLPGYAVTSYGSQGKTVDYVLLSDSAIKPATNAEQWYVSISRGRKGIQIYTPDKERLRDNIVHSGHRPLAVDLVPPPTRRISPMLARLWPYLARFGPIALKRFVAIGFPNRRTLRRLHEREHTRKLGV